MKVKEKIKRVNWIKFLFILVLSLATYFLPLNIGNDAMIVFSILVFAALMWITETIPLFLTSLIVTILVVVFRVFSFKDAVVKFADPILILFFGGFLIARAMQDIGLDKRIAKKITAKIKNDKYSLLVLMLVTAFLSMWISNTAATVVMIPIALGIVAKFGKKMANFSKATVLGIAYAANIGGVGTIIGSPPNAITVSKLSEISNIHIGFLDWIIAALPLVVILVPIAWILLLWIFPFKEMNLKEKIVTRKLDSNQKLFVVIFLITIGLWLTTRLHGLSSSLIAIMSATILFLVGILKKDDLGKINYAVLILFGGGLVLGSAMFETGLSNYFADGMFHILQGYSPLIVIFGVIIFSIGLGALASNTATAAILVPVLLPLAGALNFSPRMLAMIGGIAVSFDFLLPVGTPPNAIAYATGKISIKEMLKAGILLTIISIIVLGLFANFFWS
jgi:solute carrier family 13 (sodium-dependent dicarboxylate transporter), member 2/3/5